MKRLRDVSSSQLPKIHFLFSPVIYQRFRLIKLLSVDIIDDILENIANVYTECILSELIRFGLERELRPSEKYSLICSGEQNFRDLANFIAEQYVTTPYGVDIYKESQLQFYGFISAKTDRKLYPILSNTTYTFSIDQRVV
jgi:hypothetical protein